jgi:hypothetical protein
LGPKFVASLKRFDGNLTRLKEFREHLRKRAEGIDYEKYEMLENDTPEEVLPREL